MRAGPGRPTRTRGRGSASCTPAVVAGDGPDTLLLLEHPPVYTAGKRTEPHERPFDGTPVIDVDRGGKITWHGPGQLVGYPIVRLPDPVDVVAHVRRLEDALIDVCAGVGLATDRVEGRSGVWVRGRRPRARRKVAAIGVRVARGVTMHGFALNCDPDMTAFANMIPCGIPDAGVTSLTAELGRDVPVAEVDRRRSRRRCAAVLVTIVALPGTPAAGSRPPVALSRIVVPCPARSARHRPDVGISRGRS